jgi:predicted RNA binding protein YcfA (HicA-like mRNA interferase family)
MKSSELLRMLRKDAWYDVRQNGNHILMRHHFKSGQLVVPDHGSKEVKKGLLIAILKQADIKTTRG